MKWRRERGGVQKFVRLGYPAWLQRPDPSLGLDRFQMLERIKLFEEFTGTVCANEPTCRRIMAGSPFPSSSLASW